MSTYAQSLKDQYGRSDLAVSILTALKQAGKDVNALTRDDIATIDEFHIRGREATRELAHLADLQPGETVLDLGCGIGGPARTLAHEFGCEVTGIDIVDEYCRTAQMLSMRVGDGDRVTFERGNVMDIAYDDDTFDAVLSEHVMINIDDKAGLLERVHRVLRPNGRLVLYEICTGNAAPLYFPVPWADDESLNFLISTDELRMRAREAGFAEQAWRDVSTPSLEWFRDMIDKMASRPADAPPPLGINLLIGESTPVKVKNVARNLEEDRIRVVQGVFTRSA